MGVTKVKVRKLALALDGAIEVVHVDRPAFRTARKIFATLPPDEEAVNLMFDPPTQEFFVEQAPGVIAPLPGGWGRMGVARCDLKTADEALVHSALKAAHALARPKKPAQKAKRRARPLVLCGAARAFREPRRFRLNRCASDHKFVACASNVERGCIFSVE